MGGTGSIQGAVCNPRLKSWVDKELQKKLEEIINEDEDTTTRR